MRYLFFLLLPTTLLLASRILSYIVYDRTDRVDIMFTFDTPYEGTLRQNRQDNRIIIKLDGATIESPQLKNVASSYLSKLTITPIDNQTQIIVKVPSSVDMQASKTTDAYGLRLRFSKAAAASMSENGLPTKPSGQYEQSYYIVMVILIIGILILLWLKRKINTGERPISAKPWIFSNKKEKADGVSIRFQKPLDTKNKIVMLDYADESYLIVVGSSNLLLNKFHAQESISESEFESMLQNKHHELDTFLQIDEEEKEPLDSYKQKASNID